MSNKKTFRKYAVTTMAAATAAATVVPAAVSADTQPGFPDVSPDSDHYDAIMKLTESGVITGYENGEFGPHDSIYRGQVAVILAKQLELDVPEDLGSVLEVYSDVDENHRYAEEIAAVTEANIFTGKNGKFDPYGEISRQQMATVLVNGLGLEDYDTGADVEVNLDRVSDDHQENVQVLANLGITVQNYFDGYSDLSRGQFATFLVKSLDVIGDVEASVESVSAVNAKTIKVEFNKEISKENQEKAEFEVKRGASEPTVDVVWANDGKSVELSRNANFVAGKYTVTVSGIELAKGGNTGTVEFTEQAITTLDIKTDFVDVTAERDANVFYEAYDQYGDKIDAKNSDFEWAVSNLTETSRRVAIQPGQEDGQLVLSSVENFDAPEKGDKIRITGVLKEDTTVVTTKEVEVTDMFIEDFGLNEVVLNEDQERINESSSNKTYELDYSAVDNTGQAVQLSETDKPTDSVDNITFISSDDKIIDTDNMEVDENGKLTFQVNANTEGEVKLTAVNTNTGETTSVDIEVFAKPVPNTVEFGEVTIVSGDEKGTAELPVTFIDQYGEEIDTGDAPAEITDHFNVSITGSGDYIDEVELKEGKYLTFDDSSFEEEGTYTLTLINKKTGDRSSTQITVDEARTAAELVVDEAPDASIDVDGSTEVTFTVNDQYGDEMDFEGLGATIAHEAKEGNVSITPESGPNTFTISGNGVGKDTVTFKLTDNESGDLLDQQDFAVEVIDNIQGLDVDVSQKEYNAGDDIEVTVKAQKDGETYKDYNKSGTVEVTVENGEEKTYHRNVTFKEGTATFTVPAEKASENVTVTASFDEQTQTSSTFEIKAGTASKLEAGEGDTLLVSDRFGNHVEDYNFNGLATFTNKDGELGINLDSEDRAQIKVEDGVIKNRNGEQVTFTKANDDKEATLTVELSNDDVFEITLD